MQFVDGNDEILPNLHTIEPVIFHLSLFVEKLSAEEAVKAAADQLVALGIPREMHHNAAYTLSGGQLRRLGIACTSALHPSVLCMDEPTSGLGHIAAIKLGEHLRQMSRDCMAVVCSQKRSCSVALTASSSCGTANLSFRAMRRNAASFSGSRPTHRIGRRMFCTSSTARLRNLLSNAAPMTKHCAATWSPQQKHAPVPSTIVRTVAFPSVRGS